MMRWKLTIEYCGAPYCGWQVQDGHKTVQGVIEDAIFKFCGQQIRIHAAGRTDTGVHAAGQIAHFDLDYGLRDLSGYDLAKAINAFLKNEYVSILKAEKTTNDFHARFMATNKLYRYRIVNRPSPLTVDKGFAWHVWKDLDHIAMHNAAQMLVGKHDFSTFRDSECQAKTPIRTLKRIDIKRHGDDVVMNVEGQSFLHHQVRNMIGTLVLVGTNKWNADDFKTAFEACDRTKGGVTAPPDGLTLVRIDY